MTADLTDTIDLTPGVGRLTGERSSAPDRPRPWRPKPSSRGPARWLRGVAGVDEEILDWAPEERPRYTRLGAIIVNTGLLAGVSLFVALGKVVDTAWPLLIPIAAFWAYLVISFDGWLIASTHGKLNLGRLTTLLPRFLIAGLMGLVIAEPLLLWIFQPAIHEEVNNYRQAELAAYESQWRICNPDSGEVVNDPACDDFHLSVPNSPDSLQAQLVLAEARRDQLKGEIDDINARLAEMNELAHDECTGRSRDGTTGIVGQGENCLRDRQEADDYRRDSRLGARQAELAALDTEILTLGDQIQQASQDYGERVSQAIAEKVAAKAATQGLIGILDEDAALGRLSERSGFVLAAQWLVRALLIVLDCLPVLVKFIGGTTKYDQFVNSQLELDDQLHGKHLKRQERRSDMESRADLERFDEAERTARARRQADQRAEIDALAERLYKQGTKSRRSGPGTFPHQRLGAGGYPATNSYDGNHRFDPGASR